MTEKSNENPGREMPLRERPLAEIVYTLGHVLGPEILGYAIREKDPRRIAALSKNEDIFETHELNVLRDLAEVTETLLAKDSRDTVRQVMTNSNPNLNDESIVELFHRGESDRVVKVASEL